jgi:hypothetical protein
VRKNDANVVVLEPGSTLVITPRIETDFAPATAPAVDLTSANTMIAGSTVFSWTGVSTSTDIELNVSEPLPVEAAGGQFVDGYSQRGTIGSDPFDDGTLDTIPRQLGTVVCYKTICLQRLADPNRAHHPICNPYITVDWSMIDLHVISSAGTSVEEKEYLESLSPSHVGDEYFVSRQWKHEMPSGLSNLWDRTLLNINLDIDKSAGLQGITPAHTLGDSNFSIAAKPFIHFPWNDAPLMNTGELMLVPTTAPGRFGVEFHDNGTSQNFFGNTPRFGYYGKDEDLDFNLYFNWGDADSDLLHLFDCVHVPTRFAGTRENGRVYREPGKLNLNTLTEEGWESLKNGRSNFPNYAQFRQYRQWSATLADPNYPSEFRPFRSPSATRLVPPLEWDPDALADDAPTSATLHRLEELIDNDEKKNPYLVLENLMRLSDVTTTRSNVFAIWITVGYFEVEKFADAQATHGLSHIAPAMVDAVYPDGYILKGEMGLGDGTVRRHRAFYLIDRSAHVEDFQRGKGLDLETEKVIIKKALL